MSKQVPTVLPSFFRPGEESEAVACATDIKDAWQRHPQAVEWLTQAGEQA